MRTRRAIDKESANKINEIAREISPILFWSCNYEPTHSFAIGYDAEFLLGIQDLYKYAIDTNCLLKTLAFSPQKSICRDVLSKNELNELRRQLDLIQVLRAVIDHNQSDSNGRLAIENRNSFANWIRSQLKRDEPDSLDDYRVLCSRLDAIGDSLLDTSRTILQRILRKSDKDAIVDKWVNATLRWYCNGSRQEYYRSQLSDYYIARAIVKRPRFLYEVNPVTLRQKVNAWIRAQATHGFDSALEKLEAEKLSIRESLNRPSGFELKIQQADPEMYEKVIQERRRRLPEIDEEVVRIRGEQEAFNRRCGGDPLLYFFNSAHLESQLRETLSILKASGEDYTLLPQGLLQADVERVFKDVPSPEGDFN